jgi:hypothetical protein
MSDEIPRKPRLWRTLGLGAAAVGLATGPAAALNPQSAVADPVLWLSQGEAGENGAVESPEAGEGGEAVAQDEGGEAGEGGTAEAGEAGAALPEAGEQGEAGAAAATATAEAGGEAGESGVIDAEDPVIGILTGLALVEGHVRSGLEAQELAQTETSRTHFAHPAAELYESLEPLLEAQGLPEFEAELDTLEDATTDADREAAADALMARMSEIRTALAATPAQRFAALTAITRVAATEYEAGVQDGRVVNAEEYQDTRGFLAAARAEAEALAQSDDTTVQGAAQDVIAALDEAAAAVPAFDTLDGLPADAGAIVASTAARVELAGLRVK